MSGAAYVNPFLHPATVGRTDQGVDVTLQPGDPIFAVGNARIIGIQPNWFPDPRTGKAQPFLWYQLLDGPQRGRYVYVAEQIAPSVKPGQVVNSSEQIGTYTATGSGLELGFATASGSVIDPYNGRADGTQTAGGRAFRSFLLPLLTQRALVALGPDGQPMKPFDPGQTPDAAVGGVAGIGGSNSPQAKIANAAKDAVLGVLGDLWNSAKGDALKALLYVVFTLGGMYLSVYGLSRMLGPDNPIAQAAGGLRSAGTVAAIA
jgi:hypothetical protein